MDSDAVHWAQIRAGKQVDLNMLLQSNGFLKSINMDPVQEVYDKNSEDCLSISSDEIYGKFDSKSVQLEDAKGYFKPKLNVPLTLDVSPRITAERQIAYSMYTKVELKEILNLDKLLIEQNMKQSKLKKDLLVDNDAYSAVELKGVSKKRGGKEAG
ncbi:hypothetical protein LguiB_024183 [Lonicera macranthoides]